MIAFSFNSVENFGQTSDSLSVEIGTGFLISSENDFLPYYLINNRWGEVEEGQRLFVHGDLSYQKLLSKDFHFSTGFSFRNDFFSSHFIQFTYRELEISAGRERRTIGGLENSLSSGSLATSRNAQPIPMLSVRIDDYINVPFTRGYFKTRGHLSHGWLEENRYISNALLHSKSFYLKLDLEDEIGWTAASGVVHFAQYGGISPLGEVQPSSFSDFLRVFAGSGIPNPNGTTEGESNGLGNHLGIIETTVTQKISDHLLVINYQKPFEDRGGLQYVSLTDYLFGLEWQMPREGSFINRVYLEYIQTKWQGGPGVPDPLNGILTIEDNQGYDFGGRDDMYNNWLYRDGWTNGGMVIGNPLFLTFERTLNFFERYPQYEVAIANNRLRAVHLGLEGSLNEKLSYSAMFTYSQNFGTYSGVYGGRFNWLGAAVDPDFDYVFRPAQRQVYNVVNFKYVGLLGEYPVHLEVKLAYDFGDMYNAFGSEIGLVYSFAK